MTDTKEPTTPKQAFEIATRAASITGTLKSGAWTDIENVVAALRSLATQLEAATEARDNAVQSAKYTADLCTQALADLKLMTAERDAYKSALEFVVDCYSYDATTGELASAFYEAFSTARAAIAKEKTT